ncbi:MAG: AbrB/MazE/SpoVT family DNA-binding domain-containing protein [Candidatus Solibacter usitatus]|nr:AbrB/MazE/SpoVT family DNA-binding domain-containing protein [Candidatus Solibacter usitatus]
MLTVTVSSKGQIAIPKQIRERLDIREGTKLALYAEGRDLILRRALSPDWRQMQGAYKGPSLNEARKQERRKELLRDAKGH